MQGAEGVAFSPVTQQCLEEDSGEEVLTAFRDIERQVKTGKTLLKVHTRSPLVQLCPGPRAE